MRTHLTWQEIEKYLDTSDFTDEYLLWMENVSEHIDECEICQKRIHKAMITEHLLEEDNIKRMFELASQEEEIRKNIVICKLFQMAQNRNELDNRKHDLINIIQNMQTQMTKAYVIQTAMLQRQAGVSRGNENSIAKEDLEIRYENHCLQVSQKNEPEKKFSVVLNQDGKEPQIAQALWKDSKECYVAEFEWDNNQTNFEIYLIP